MNPVRYTAQTAQRVTEPKEMIFLAQDSQSERYQLTINNPLEKEYTHQRIVEIFRQRFQTLEYLCLADEQGTMFHTHIFVCFSSRVRFSMLKRYFPEAHIEQAKGSVSDNVMYIKKTGKWENDRKHETRIEGSYEEFGTQPPDSRGKRMDMSHLYQMILDDMTNAQILSANQDYILQIEKLDKVRTTILAERFRDTVRLDLEVTYLSGQTGTGKTRGVLEQHGYGNVYRVTDYQHPFDGYNCQPIIAFEEFRSSLRLNDMLQFCDIYPIELPARYSNKYACYNKVYIISNWPLERQYSELQKDDEESWNAFLRRIHKVIHYEDREHITAYDSVQAYMERNTQFHPLSREEQYHLPFAES